jgi:hypothetical protein
LSTEASDAEGKSVVKVAPGQYNVFLYDPPKGYVKPQRFMFNEGEAVEVKAGSSVPFEFKLNKGLSLAGRVLDQAGIQFPTFLSRFAMPRKIGARTLGAQRC